MTKANIAQYSTTAADNTDINDISLAENVMKPPAVNNAMREQMAQLAQWTGEGTIASAATMDIGAQAEEFLNVTGTTTVTALGTVRAGTKRRLLFAGALTLTHNATSLILRGEDLVVGSGDIVELVSEGAGNWRLVNYWPATKQRAYDASAGYGGAITVASSIDLSGVANFVFLSGSGTITSITLGAGQQRSARINNSAGCYFTASSGLRVNGASSGTFFAHNNDRVDIVGVGGGIVFVWVTSPPVTNWVSYTPAFTSFGTVSNVAIQSRRVGSSLEIRGRFTTGTLVGAEARMTLGFDGTSGNVSSSSTLIPTTQVAGIAIPSVAQSSSFYTLIGSSLGYIQFGKQGGSDAALSTMNATGFPGAGSISITASVPIEGWQ